MKISITSIGAISALGNTASENFDAIKNNISGIKQSAKYGFMLAEIPLDNQQIISKYNLPKEDYSRTSLLGIAAATEAWGNNKICKEIKTGFISATSIGAIDKIEEYYFLNKKNNNSDYHHLLTHDNGSTTERIAQELGITGYINTISTACSSGANAIMLGARLLQANILDRVVVGASEPLALFEINGFHALQLLDSEICTPFDDARKGLNLGEGAAYLVLENDNSMMHSGNKPLCFLSGWGNAADAYHQTASSPDGIGATLSMQQAMQIAKLQPQDIDYINAHGTGTSNNDLSESMAIQNVFGNNIPAFSTTKNYTGHTLATAGAIEAVLCVQSILAQCLLPTFHFSTPMQETGLRPVSTFTQNAVINSIISNSFGFGGNCTSLIFSKI
jgi:3-oxoacyl-(acyl-carrier-protein) synthase